jgi:hypothetical protein
MKNKSNCVPEKVAASFLLEAMSNLRPSTTGVDGAVIWVSAGEFDAGEHQHGPRIEVVVGTKINTAELQAAVAVTISAPPEVLGTLPPRLRRQVVEFVRRNREALIRHWNGEIDTKKMLDLLQKLEAPDP